ncbi:MAG: alpha/beta hydrolase [Pelagimonas sp.]|uniref:alpha/beta hydrolase n=1 Tax=Pelagimonas sp. TaxID=2073170 RepID=UPI003D6A5E11
MQTRLWFLIATFGLALALSGQPVVAQDISRVVNIDRLAQVDPLNALRETDVALRDPRVVGTPPDIRILLDLLQLRAELLEQLGQTMAAGDAWASVARTRAFSRSHLRQDPVPDFKKAAALYEQERALGRARSVIEAAIAAEQETGLEDETLLGLYEHLERLASLDNDPKAADMAAAAREALTAPTFEARTQDPKTGFRVVDVYYATDRARTGDPAPTQFYGSERNTHLELGVATVTIPESHIAGTVERPSVWRLEFGPSPTKHILLKSVEPVDVTSFFGRLQGEFADTSKRDLFVYIHGFNHSFEYAAQRAAQITFDMGNAAVPVLFSWPSRNRTAGYFADAAVVRLSGRRLAVFLEDLVQQSGAQTIHVLAHSMGSRALTDALEIMALKRGAKPQDAPIFGQVMFAAPDVDTDLFGAMARVFKPLAKRMTLYASSTDWALVSSHKLHGASPRAGLGGDLLLSADGLDSIDMTAMGEDMLAHNYFSNDSSALADMATLFWQDASPEQRCGLQVRGESSQSVWDYRTGQCPTNEMISVFSNLKQHNISKSEEARKLVVELVPDQGRTEFILSLIERILTDSR